MYKLLDVMHRTKHWRDVSRTITLFFSFYFSFLCHCSVSSSFGNTPVMCDGLPVILGNKRVEQGRQSRDFEVKESWLLFEIPWTCTCRIPVVMVMIYTGHDIQAFSVKKAEDLTLQK